MLYVGRLAADKNVETLLRAFALPSRLQIIGEGPLRESLKRLSVELGIASVTTFLPFVPHSELPAYYQSGDVLVVPSDRLETFCMLALEAIACGCPLVSTDQVPEVVRRFPGVPSVTPCEVEGFRRLIDDALSGGLPAVDPTRMDEYGWSGVARQYHDVHLSALRQPTSQ